MFIYYYNAMYVAIDVTIYVVIDVTIYVIIDIPIDLMRFKEKILFTY